MQFEDITGPSSNGTWDGVEYFKCKHRRGRFVLLAALEPGKICICYCLVKHVYVDSVAI